MSNLKNYIKKRKQFDPAFAEGLESDYVSFKLSVLFRQAMTQFESLCPYFCPSLK